MNRVLLIGDTHPEMIAIANKLAMEGVHYQIILPTYFTFAEAEFLTRFRIINSKYHPWLIKRTLNPRIAKENLIRTYALLEFFSWILRNKGFHNLSWYFFEFYSYCRRRKITSIIASAKSNLIVSYDSMIFPKTLKQDLVVICPMAHPAKVQKQLSIAKNKFPNWPEMLDEAPAGNNDTALTAKKIVVLSAFAKQSYIDQGFRESQIEIINIGPINGNRSPSYKPEYNSSKKLHLLYLGRMTRVKGIDAIMQVSELLNPEDFKISLVGQCSPNIVKYIKGNSNNSILELVSDPTPHEVEHYFRQADIFVLPSFCEGFSVASLEAMSFGLIPILSTNTGACEILKNTKLESLIIEPGNVEQILNRLLLLNQKSPTIISELKELSIDLSQKYSFDNFANDFYRLLIRDFTS